LYTHHSEHVAKPAKRIDGLLHCHEFGPEDTSRDRGLFLREAHDRLQIHVGNDAISRVP
jgi:hypothetical protein